MPAQSEASDFYVTVCCPVPQPFQAEGWKLTIDGEVEGGPVEIPLEALRALGSRRKEQSLVCVSASPSWRALDNARWAGLPLAEVFDHFGVRPTSAAVAMKFHGADGYYVFAPTAQLGERDFWFIWEMNGAPLDQAHGFPLRVLTPGEYGYKSTKWVQRIELVTVQTQGYWEQYGYPRDAPIRPVSYFKVPAPGAQVPRGTVAVGGAAFAGSVAIERVEVSADGGNTWRDVVFTYASGKDVWVTWAIELELPEPGEVTLLTRATDADGRVSQKDWVDDHAGFFGYDTMRVVIT